MKATQAIFLLLVASCHAPNHAIAPRQDTSALSDMAFLHYLATAPTVTVEEGVRALSLLSGDGNTVATKPSWGTSPDSVLDKGMLAYMLRTVCKLPRSANEVLLAGTTGLGDRRYALQTCIYEGLMPYGRAGEPVTGGELLSALTAAEKNQSCRVGKN